MAHESIGAPSCLSAFSRKSRSNGLAHSTSTNVSTLHVRSWGALALGVICGGVTGFVLFEDVLAHNAKITTDHVLTGAVLAITAASGHMWWQRLWSRTFVLGLGLLLIFCAGLVYLVVASGGRNAEVMIAKRNAALAGNIERERLLKMNAEAEYILGPCPDGTPARHVGERCGLRAAMTAECASGKGKRCEGRAYSVSTYEDAIRGREAALAELGSPVEENGALKSTARVLVAWYDVPEDEREATEARYVERLELVVPYIKAVLVEIATIVFLAVGIGHRRTSVSRPQPATIPATVPATMASTIAAPRHATVTQLRPSATVANVEAVATQLLRRSPTVPQAEIVRLFGGNKSRASRWLGRLEREGTVSRWSEGRQKFVTLREQVGYA